MCKILVGVRKSDIKIISRKKRKKICDQLQLAYNEGLKEIRSISANCFPTNNCNNVYNDNRKEKSRTAAKERRHMENDSLSQLYFALPVSSKSRLLSCDDSHFIGFFEKTTIIKVAAYVLKLYNALSASNRLPVFNIGLEYNQAMFSESLIGIFWCERTGKIVFTTPGLARLTGHYWCNLIGMPINSVLVDFARRVNVDPSSHLTFLRFMKNALNERGIFTVQPSQRCQIQDLETSDRARPSSSSQIIGRMPVSVLLSERLSNNIRFEFIQPLNTKSTTANDNLIYINSGGALIQSLPTNYEHWRKLATVRGPFSAYFEIDTLGLIAVEQNLLTSLGYSSRELDHSNIYSFFHLEDIVNISIALDEVLAEKSTIKQILSKIATAKESIYRLCQCTIQVIGEQELNVPNMQHSRSSTTQGESYSQTIIDAINSLDELDSVDTEMKNSYLQLRMIPACLVDDNGDEIYETTPQTRGNESSTNVAMSFGQLPNTRQFDSYDLEIMETNPMFHDKTSIGDNSLSDRQKVGNTWDISSPALSLLTPPCELYHDDGQISTGQVFTFDKTEDTERLSDMQRESRPLRRCGVVRNRHRHGSPPRLNRVIFDLGETFEISEDSPCFDNRRTGSMRQMNLLPPHLMGEPVQYVHSSGLQNIYLPRHSLSNFHAQSSMSGDQEHPCTSSQSGPSTSILMRELMKPH